MPTIEDSLKLDLHRLIKDGTIVPGARSVGKLGFADTNLVIGFEYVPGYLTIKYPCGAVQRFEVAEVECGFHRKLYLVVDGRRRVRIYLPPGGNFFHTREAWKLKYSCWTIGKKKRRDRHLAKIRARLTGPYDMHVKPRGMPRSAWMRDLISLAELEGEEPA